MIVLTNSIFEGLFLLVIRLAFLSAIFFVSQSSFADFQWTDSSTWNRARVVSPGQHSWSFRSSYQNIDSRFGADGKLQNLGRPFDRTWSWNQILSEARVQADGTEATLREYVNDNNLNEKDIAASTEFGLKREETTFELSWAYGLAERWMIGLQVPFSIVKTRLETQTSMTPHLSRALQAAATPADVRKRVEALVESRLNSEGYNTLQPETNNLIIGDVSLINQFALLQKADWAFSVQQLVKIPSPPNSDVADYIRYSRGDGQIDLGVTTLTDYKWEKFLFGLKVGYIRPLPDTKKMRVPVSDDSAKIVDRNVRRNLGDLVTLGFETFYNLNRRWTLNGAYLGFFKGADRYSGDTNSALYSELGANTQQELHLARAGVSYLIGSPTARNNIENKWVANVNFYQPVIGRNIGQGPQGALELQAFF